MAKVDYMIVSAYDPIEPDLVIMRAWLGLPNLLKISGRVRIRIPMNGRAKDDKESMLDAYCGLLKVLNIRYDFAEEKTK